MAEYSEDERRQLISIAHEAVAAALENRELDLTPPSEHLAEHRGAFTTLHEKGELRGCVGYVFPMYSLYRTIAETAVAAALKDTRFMPVGRDELPKLEVEISVLSPIQPIDPDDVEIGRHGLLITYGSRRGLLLPQVPVEHDWDRLTFLQQTCVKAGLPTDAWEHGAKVEGFTAEVFGETGRGC
jgi:AmmeMemoRadiSam system protein A